MESLEEKVFALKKENSNLEKDLLFRNNSQDKS